MKESFGNFDQPKKIFQNRLAAVLLWVICGSLASLPFFWIGEDQKVGCCGGEMPVTHDSWMHFNQMQAFAKGLAAGKLYPRWDETTHEYGAPTTSFYPPGVYYITSAFYFLTGEWKASWIGYYWVTAVGAALSAYWYARRKLSHPAAIAAMWIYVFAPYHLINQYQRGAMGEFCAFVWVPLILGFAERLLGICDGNLSEHSVRKPNGNVRWLNFTGLAASFGALLWTHPPTAYQLLLVFGPCLALAALYLRRWKRIPWVLGALMVGSMLAGAYFYPAIVEQNLVNYDDVERTWPYHASYVYDSVQKVYDRAANPFFPRIDRIWSFNLLLIITSGSVLYANWRGRRNEGREVSRRSIVWGWAAAGLWASFLMTGFSAPVGSLIPMIKTGVFSWRMLTLTSFSMAMLAGALVDLRWRGWSTRAGTLWKIFARTVVVAGTLGCGFWIVVWPMVRGQAFEPNPNHYNFATLPRGAGRETPAMEKVQTASGGGRIVIGRWSPEDRGLQVDLARDDQLQFRTLNFPGWTATVDDQVVTTKNGAAQNIVIDLPAGTHRVRLEFKPTPIRRFGQWCTILSLTTLISLTPFFFFTSKRQPA